MRFLALSDIHGNVEAVQRLRSREENSFDAVVVAGDIGSRAATEVFSILCSFECPVLYVYGNHDAALEYSLSVAGNAHHLHLSPVTVSDWVLVGYSGLPVQWGRNPIAEQLEAEVDHRHRELIAKLTELQGAERERIATCESECARELAALAAVARDRRRKAYPLQVGKIQAKKDAAIGRIRLPVVALRESASWRLYQEERWQAAERALALNRQALAAVVRQVGPSRTIVVTHERQTNTAEEFGSVPLFLFGHRHGFRNTLFKGSRFINVSALDAFVTMLPEGLKHPSVADMRNVDLGTYVVIEIDRHGSFTVQPRRFMEAPWGWLPVPDWQDPKIRPFRPGLD
jgi:hypothetical protein